MNVKNIEVKFQYQDKIVTIKSETYRTIKEVKEKAMKKFFKIPKDVHCFYLARDLINYENNIIGEFFNNREKVTLKLMLPRKNASQKRSQLSDLSEEKIISGIYLNTNVFSPGFNNVVLKKLKGNSIEVKERKKRDGLVLPPIKSKKQALQQKENTYQKYDLDIVNTEEKEDNLCENCGKDEFSEYCRNCKEFICVNCKKNDKHINHLFIHLNSNLESNIKIYGNILLTDIEYFKINHNNINKNDDKFTVSSLFNTEDLEKKQKSLINKIKEIFDKYEAVINDIKNELIIERETRIKDLINSYNENSLKITNDINQLIKNLENQKEEIKIKQFKNFFEKMSENEDKINNINKDIIKYHLISQINNKIESLYNNMDQIAKETIKDEKNPFDLEEPILNTELNSILNKIEKKDSNQNNRNNNPRSKTTRKKTDKTIKEENINNFKDEKNN